MKIYFLIIIFIYCNLALGNSYPSLISIDEILDNPYLARLYYQKLKERFNNRDFDTPTRFNPDISRLSEDDYQHMIETLKEFFHQYPRELDRIYEEVHVAPFQLDSQNTVELPTRQELEKWESIGSQFSQVSDDIMNLEFLKGFAKNDQDLMLSQLQKELNLTEQNLQRTFSLANKDHQEALINVLKKQFNRKKDQRIKRALADVMLAIAAGPIRLEKIQDPAISVYQKYFTFEDIESTALKLAKEYNLPGMITDDLRGHSSFKNIPRSKMFKKGTVVMPMTRGEAIFKGIGPGECVSSSCHRYLDAFFNDSMHFKILKDGKETGYVGVYKVKDEYTGAKYWFIETVQSPHLVNDKAGNKKVRELVKQLQQLAIRDNSIIVVPTISYNSYNFKEVVHAFSEIPELITGVPATVNYRNPHQIEAIKAFSANDNAYNYIVATNSHYQGTNLINGLEIELNNRAVSLSNPLIDQPDWYWKAYDESMTIGKVSKIDPDFKLPPLKRAELILQYSSAMQGKRAIEEMIEVAFKNGDQPLVKKLKGKLYQILPETQQDKPFKDQLKYAKPQIKKNKLENSSIYKLKAELALAAQSWKDYLAIVDLGKAKEKSSVKFLMESLSDFSHKAEFGQVLSLVKGHYSSWANEQLRIELFNKLVERAQTPNDFIELLHFNRSLPVDIRIPDRLKNQLYHVHWEKMYEKVPTAQGRDKFIYETLNEEPNYLKLAKLEILINEAKTIDDLKHILETFPKIEISTRNKERISSGLVDRLGQLIEESDLKEVTSGKLNWTTLNNHIDESHLSKLRIAYADKIKTLDDFNKLFAQEKIDERTLRYISLNRDVSSEVHDHVRKLMQEKSYVNSLFKFNDPLPIDEKVHYSDHSTLYSIIEKSLISDSDREKIKRSSIIDGRIMNVDAARSFSLYLDTVYDYPIDFQKSFLQRLLSIDKNLYNRSLATHRELADKLRKWGAYLEGQGVANAQRYIAVQLFTEDSGIESGHSARFENCLTR